jgi:hypothetical protein
MVQRGHGGADHESIASAQLLISGELMWQKDLPSIYFAVSLGRVKLRGREKTIELIALERKTAERRTA